MDGRAKGQLRPFKVLVRQLAIDFWVASLRV